MCPRELTKLPYLVENWPEMGLKLAIFTLFYAVFHTFWPRSPCLWLSLHQSGQENTRNDQIRDPNPGSGHFWHFVRGPSWNPDPMYMPVGTLFSSPPGPNTQLYAALDRTLARYCPKGVPDRVQNVTISGVTLKPRNLTRMSEMWPGCQKMTLFCILYNLSEKCHFPWNPTINGVPLKQGP